MDIELPGAIAAQQGRWVEYGIVERTYAHRCPDDFATIVERFGRRAITPSQHTASTFIARALGDLSRTGHVICQQGKATGIQQRHLLVGAGPGTNWDDRLSWADAGLAFDYVPGSTEGRLQGPGL